MNFTGYSSSGSQYGFVTAQEAGKIAVDVVAHAAGWKMPWPMAVVLVFGSAGGILYLIERFRLLDGTADWLAKKVMDAKMREMIRSAATAPLAKNEDKHDGNHQDDPEKDEPVEPF